MPFLRRPPETLALQWARLARDTDDPDSCVLFGHIEVADLAYDKQVTVRYRATPSAPWQEVAAVYQSFRDLAHERWYFRTAPFAGSAAEYSVQYAVAGQVFDEGRAYAVSAGGVVLAAQPVLVTSLFLDDALNGTIAVRADAHPQALAVIFSEDHWQSVRAADASFVSSDGVIETWGFSTAGVSHVELAARLTSGAGESWDNFWGQNHQLPTLSGRWDLTVHSPSNGTYASWLELGGFFGDAPGRFVGRFGNARPIWTVSADAARVYFQLPSQWEVPGDLRFDGAFNGAALAGTVDSGEETDAPWSGTPRAALTASTSALGDAQALFDGASLSGWRASEPSLANQWHAHSGVLVNSAAGSGLVTAESYGDFLLHLEFLLPAGGNSGVYLRGRYELQVQDDAGATPTALTTGAIYGFLTPTTNAAFASGTWQALDVELRGQIVTIDLNGVRVIDHQTIPGITGGALDSAENAPGPIVLQGDHSAVQFRNLTIAVPR